MNYIKQLQADKAEAIQSARAIETELNDLISYLCCDKFRVVRAYKWATCYGYCYPFAIMLLT